MPPLLGGAVGDKSLRLAGELADGAILTGGATLQHVREAGELLRAGRRAAGRDDDADIVAFVAVERSLDAAAVAERVSAYASAGASHVARIAVGEHGRSLAEYVGFVAREVRPLVE
jgi:alkanesulfonate monooxygenase SsuD/methylene tetrahydromethanopterin reductase-like flavin-dependent oxidoreductase (luciferase family)